MKQTRHTTDQIIEKFRQADIALGKDQNVPEICKILEVTAQTYYRRWQKYGEMAPEMAKQLKSLEKENVRLKKLVAEQALDNQILTGSREGKLVSPKRRQRTITEVRRRWGPEKVLERRACKVLGQPRGTQRYAKGRPADEAKLLEEMRRIARKRPRFGSPRIHDTLGKRGWSVNHKRVARLWREEGIQVPKKHHKKRRSPCGGSEHSCVRKRALRPNHVWSYDFVEDRTEHNRKLRMLVVIDEFTRESLAIEVTWSFTAAQVVEVLGYLFAVRGVRGAYQHRPRP